MLDARRQNDGATLVFSALFGAHYFDISAVLHGNDVLKLNLGALGQDLVQHLLGELIAAHLQRSRIVLHLGRVSDLPAEPVLLDDQRALSVALRVKCCRHSCGAAADYNNIMHLNFLLPIYPISPNVTDLTAL